MSREAIIDVALWATVPPRGPIEEVQALVDAGAAAFKLSTFETHPQRFPRIPDAQLLRAFAAIARAGGLAGVHAENDEIVRAGIAAEQAAGHGGRSAGPRPLAPAGRRARGDRPLPRAGAGHRRATARLSCLDASRGRSSWPRPAATGST